MTKDIETDEVVLVVDDDRTNLTLAHKILKEKYRIALANSGEAALKYLENHVPDLILLDINMPDMDGFQVMEELKRRGLHRVPVIFLTAFNSIEMETRCFQVGAIDFVSKPFVPEVLLSRVRKTLELEKYRESLEDMVAVKTKQVERITLQAITAIANTIDAKDEYTKGHSIRVAEYSALIAENLGWNAEEVQNMRYIALLHDIGKIGVPDSVLNKPGKLTDVEFQLIKSHTVIGGEILKDITMVAHVTEGAKYHHERYDGAGYPEHFAGTEIPLHARIIGIADAYDAMNSDRVYRKKMSEKRIYKELEKGRGTQFDPEILDIVLMLLETGKIKEIEQNEEKEVTAAEEGNQLLQRVLNDISIQKREAEERDYLTGLFIRKVGEKQIKKEMEKAKGFVVLIDMDNLKQVNDVYGHLSGDFALKTVAEILQNQANEIISARFGGDEFLCYLKTESQKKAEEQMEQIMEMYQERKEAETVLSATSLSIGMCATISGDSYETVLHNADRALYHVKQTGKGGFYFYTRLISKEENESSIDLKLLMKVLMQHEEKSGVFNVRYREFSQICDYIGNLAKRYEYAVQLVMVTAQYYDEEEIDLEQQNQFMGHLHTAISDSLRSVDVVTRFSNIQYLIILVNATSDKVDEIMNRIFQRLYKMIDDNKIEIVYDVSEFKEY